MVECRNVNVAHVVSIAENVVSLSYNSCAYYAISNRETNRFFASQGKLNAR